MSIYERISILRDQYQDSENYVTKCAILCNLMDIAFHNKDTLPEILALNFPYFESSYSTSTIKSMILKILQDLEMPYHFTVATFVNERIIFTFIRN